MKKKYKLLTVLKKIKKNSLFNSLGTLHNEKNKLENVNSELQKLRDKSSFKEGSVISSSQLKNNCYFRADITEKIEISRNRKLHIEKEILDMSVKYQKLISNKKSYKKRSMRIL